MNNSDELISALMQSRAYPHPVKQIKMLETHISWVFLTGEKAYKIKKPVDFGFLNYTDLEQRHQFCEQEIKLNAFLASDIYHQVVTINQTKDGFKINGDGPVVEYAIEMAEFSQDGLLNKCITQGKVTHQVIKDLAHQVAEFHLQAPLAADDAPYGQPETVYAPIKENFEQARSMLTAEQDLTQLKKLEQWAEQQQQKLLPELKKRKANKMIRACHGDIHLGNITFFNNKTMIFDCIEFNEFFRWTDTMAEVGFLIMDLLDHQRPDLAATFLNTYMERTGDYHGLTVLPYYIAYRAMVRAKIQLFSLQGKSTEEEQQLTQRYRDYADIAMSMMNRENPSLYVMHGFSASGKSTVAKFVVREKSAIRLRSDVERKRLFPQESASHQPGGDLNSGLYEADKSRQTYNRLAELTRHVISCGYNVVIDATCLKDWQRDLFEKLSQELNIPFSLLHCEASLDFLENALKKRSQERPDNVSDATIDVLHLQRDTASPLSSKEKKHLLSFNVEELGFEQDLQKAVVDAISGAAEPITLGAC